jgi:hypothetical protein
MRMASVISKMGVNMNTNPIVTVTFDRNDLGTITFNGFFNSLSGDYLYEFYPFGCLYACDKQKLHSLVHEIEKRHCVTAEWKYD